MSLVPFDSLSLACIVTQLREWRGARVRKITQPQDTRVSLSLYLPERGETRLLLDCSARLARAHFTSRREKTPDAAPNFCMALRKHLEGAELLEVEQIGFDRILKLSFEAEERVTLVAELMGKHSNLLLLSADERILAVAKPISSRVNRVRTLLPNREYELPPRSELPDPRQASQEEFSPPSDATSFASWLRESYEGISPFLANEIATRVEGNDFWRAFENVVSRAREERWTPVSVHDENGFAGAYPLQLRTRNGEPREDFSQALDEAWTDIETRETNENARRTLSGQLESALKAREAALSQLQKGLQEGGRAAKARHRAELIQAYGFQIAPGASEAMLPDWNQENELVRVPLDPQMTPPENAARLFERAKKAEANREGLLLQRDKLQLEADQLRAALHRLNDELDEVRALASERGWLQTQSPTKNGVAAPSFDGHRVRALTSPDGYSVLVGENAQANDYLVRRASHSNDFWLHARAGTSAHAIVKTNNQPDRVPLSTLRFAAEQVARRSAGKHANVVAVDYTLRKYVRRPRNAAPGSVLREREKTLDVSPQGDD